MENAITQDGNIESKLRQMVDEAVRSAIEQYIQREKVKQREKELSLYFSKCFGHYFWIA